MKTILAYDTETTGLPDWKNPSGGETQPHIVQIAAILADEDTKRVLGSIDLIIKPDGWEIPEETIEIHGITNEMAQAAGIPEKEALEMFLKLAGKTDKLVAHNRTFDKRIIRIATKRYSSDEAIESWSGNKDSHDCTMLLAKPIMEMLPKGRFGSKNPKLEEAYKFFTGNELENAHNAMADAQACMEVYWGIKEKLSS